MNTELLNNIFLLNIFEFVAPVYSYFLCCIGAIFAGTVVGKEREKAQKAAGLRTFAMVALGSCVFTLATRLMISSQTVIDLSRIPAQIVSGVGFLGAGAVFRSGRIVSGLTTAAGIWATAAVGLVFGLGFFTFGLSVTFMIFILLWIHSFLEKRSLHTFDWVNYEMHFDSQNGKGQIILGEIVQDWGHKFEKIEGHTPNVIVWQFRLCPAHKPHQRFLSELASQALVLKLEQN